MARGKHAKDGVCVCVCVHIGGADGTILQWDVSDGKLMDARFAGPSIQLKSPFGPGDKHAPGVR